MTEYPKKVSRITAIVNRGGAAPVIDALAEHGIHVGHLAASRSIVLEEKNRFFGGGKRTVLAEDPIDILSFLVSPAAEEAALKRVMQVAGLEVRGRGMAYSETVHLLAAHELCGENHPAEFTVESDIPFLSDLMGLCCIVQRGHGDEVARVSLDTGTCVPAITFGRGTGVRDKLGLLRITIPAEKEVIHVVTDSHGSDAVMRAMMHVGRLDQPGRGFIYAYPLNRGIVNTNIMRGMARHAASIEQIIAALDELKGGKAWRRRAGTAGSGKGGKVFLLDLIDLTLFCDEGRGEELVKAAMEVGAAGATISLQKHIRPQASRFTQVSQARECCNMIVSQELVPAIGEALKMAGAFDDGTHGQLYSRQVPKAFTYLGKA